MILATDVHYNEQHNTALAAGVVFSDWRTSRVVAEYAVTVEGIAPYEPGAFYKRELPCLMELLSVVAEEVTLIIVDSYVDLGPGHPGLGRHLYDTLGGSVPVVGVAKTRFAGCTPAEVLRGGSAEPLYITTAGIDLGFIVEEVRGMHGPHRIPTLLKRVDALSRGRKS